MSRDATYDQLRRWRRGLLLVAMLALVVAMSAVTASAHEAADVDWEDDGPDTTAMFVSGNPTCGQFSDEVEFKIQPVVSGTYTVEDATITPKSATDDLSGVVVHLRVRQTAGGQVFDYEIHGGVADVVVVKGGPNANLYDYENPPGATPGPQSADDGLHSPFNPGSEQWYGLSHISFCINPADASTSLSVSDPASGEITVNENQTFTLEWSETNDGNVDLTDPDVTSDNLLCNDSMAYSSGDANSDGILNPGETWVFTCTTSIASAGDHTIAAFGHGTYDGQDVTYCAPGTQPADTICDPDERAEVDVTVLRPSTDLTLDTTRSDSQVLYGGDATLYFVEENDSADNTLLSNVYVEVVEGPCAPDPLALDAKGHDGTPDNGDDVLDPGEKWRFSCTVSNVTSDTTVKVVGHGTTATGQDVTWVAECATGTQAAGIFCDADEQAEARITVLRPSTTLSITNGDGPISVPVGTPVTLTFAETNDGDVDLTSPSVTVDNCTAVYSSGDADADGELDVGETWTFTCQVDTSVAGSTTYTATGSGFDPAGREVTYCGAGVNGPNTDDTMFCDEDERDSIVVEVFEVGEGCTPGYWKNHLDSWAATGYSPSDSFNATFGTDLSEDITLEQAINWKGGQLDAVVRHITAALLNAAHPDVDYAYSVAEVMQLWEQAQSDPQAVLNQIVPENEQGCPIS